ncbi:MAG: TolB family protein [Phototrophicaceae bacterium]
MVKRFAPVLLISLLVLLSACAQSTPVVPTRVILEPTVDVNAARSTALAAAAATRTQAALPPTHGGPTLPPSWTPTDPPVASDTPAAPPTLPPPVDELLIGWLYYIYNADSIARVRADGTGSELIVTFGVDRSISDLTAAPDGSLLAFVAPGNGSAREVWVTSPDGSYLQQISCLGFSEVLAPAWSADSSQLAFIAAPAPGAARTLHVAGVAGSNICPQGNNQRQITATTGSTLSEVVWSADGERLFFSDTTLFSTGLDGSVSSPLTLTLGFGPDRALSIQPGQSTQLTYLAIVQGSRPTARQIDVSTALAQGQPRPEFRDLPVRDTQALAWSADGRYLVYVREDEVMLYDTGPRSTRTLVEGLTAPQEALFAPYSTVLVAYTAQDPDNPGIPQVYVFNRRSGAVSQVTAHTEGTVADVLWLDG